MMDLTNYPATVASTRMELPPILNIHDYGKEPVIEPVRPKGKFVHSCSYSALGLEQHRFKGLCEVLAEQVPMIMSKHDADTIVVRGTSGVSVAFGMRMLMGIRTVVARKAGEASHAGMLALLGEQNGHVERYVILDDFQSSGRTVKGIVEDMRPGICAAVIEYRGLRPGGRLYRKGFGREFVSYCAE